MNETASQPTGSIEEAAGAFASLLNPDDGATQEEEDKPVEAEPDDAALEGADEAESEEAAEDEEAPEQENAQPEKLHTVKVDGKELQVPLAELVKGYQREADYTRKTQQVAEQRKAAVGELESAKAERAHYAQQLAFLQQQLQQNAQQEPDWDALLAQNPIEYMRLQREFGKRQAALNHAQSEAQRVAAREQADQERLQADHVEAEKTKLTEAIPEWKDVKVQKSEKSALVDFAVNHGYTADELAGVTDHRVVVLLRKAMLHDQALAKRAAIKPVPQPGSVKPAVPGNVRTQSTVANAKKRLAQTGAVEDAAAVFSSMI